MASVLNSAVRKEVPDDQDEEKHEKPRHFSFSVPNQRLYSVSGTINQTVLEALESSDKFKSLVERNQEKGMLFVIKKPHHADIAAHFPCYLIEESEELTIRFSLKTSVPEPDKGALKSEQLVTFYIARAEGPNLKRKHLKYMGNQDIPYLCIYAYLGETVREALERDGRFSEIAFEEGSELFCIEDSQTVEMCYKVNESLDGKRYRLEKDETLSKETSGSGSRPADQVAGPSREQAKSTPGSEKLVPAKSLAGVKRKSLPVQGKSIRKKPCREYHPIPGSEELQQELRSRVEGQVVHMKEREKVEGDEVLELLRQEHGKNIDATWRKRTGKRLRKKSRSVCYIMNHSNGRQGTGFLLFDRFVLTNAHLIQGFSDIRNVELSRDHTDIRIQVNFSSKRNRKTEHNVKRVVHRAFKHTEKKLYLGYALLELDVDTVKGLPAPLLSYDSSGALRGGVCIIGHPDSGEREFDFCSIIECGKTRAAFDVLQFMKLDSEIVAEDSPVISSNSCFLSGSTGSPVFTADGKLFAMHSGGYLYKTDDGTMSVIEFAIPLQLVLEHLFVSLPDKGIQKIKEEPHTPLQSLISTLGNLLKRESLIYFPQRPSPVSLRLELPSTSSLEPSPMNISPCSNSPMSTRSYSYSPMSTCSGSYPPMCTPPQHLSH